MINSVCGIRSTGRICTDIAEVLSEYGNDCKIIYGRENVPQKYEKYAIKRVSNLNVKINALKARLFDNEGFNARGETKKIINEIKEFNPDIIHLHNLHGYFINVELLFAFLKNYNKPVIWTLHDCWTFTGHCSYFDLIGCEKWKTGCYSCPQHKLYPKSYTDRSKLMYERKKKCFTGVENMTLVTPSKWIAELVKQSFLKEYPVKVIHNGIDLSVFKPTEGRFRKKYNLQNKKIILGVASAWGKRKGLEDFIKLSKKVSDDYKIVLVGLKEKQIDKMPKEILSLATTNSAKELAEIYTAADVFVNLTYQDNYPTVNLEAQACGTPAITYRTGGSIESVPNEYVVEKGDLENLVIMIESICQQGRKNPFVENVFFDARTAFKQYMELYKNVTVS